MTFDLDCSMGEGGGSIVRISAALASTFNQPLRLFNIRSKRSNPGLRPQHIEAINAINQFSGMIAENIRVGDTEVILRKGSEKKDKAIVQIKTAGSIGLVAQAVLYYSFSQKRDLTLTINGGATHGKWAPSVEYVENITHNFVEKMGRNISNVHEKYGFYPKGGARTTFQFKGHKNLTSLNLVEKGILEKITIYSTVSKVLATRNVA
ncbi:MAG: hypothetical protein KAJ30_00100, partial [Candidatus Heimdallarchaeota archaeon]|nr:hypothetical protein [Candidatus Heimdallarchaeota archaeon]